MRRAGRRPTEVIDRDRVLGFSFNGRAVEGHPGDTIVSALAALGIRAYGQGRRLQTRRGPLTADRFDPNCNLQVDDEPNVPAAHRLAANGLSVRSQHVWPSLDFDLKSVNQRLARRLRPERELSASSAGTFLRPAYRRLLAKVTVGGRLGSDGGTGRVRHVYPDVLVAGGGLAGLAAAAAAAASGADVLVVDADHSPGGWWRSGSPGEDGGSGAELARAGAALVAHGGELVSGAVVIGATAEGTVLVSVDRPGSDELLVCRAGHVVLAHGAVERTLTFTGNDLPGVMLATGARRLARLWSVRPGERVLVFAANDHGEGVAADLEATGAKVVEVLDARQGATIRSARGTTELE
jgi:sarcosine oxidase subunit alpha